MQVVYERCCGMDVHKKTISACVITPEGRETRTYGTFTAELLEALGWLRDLRVTHVAILHPCQVRDQEYRLSGFGT